MGRFKSVLILAFLVVCFLWQPILFAENQDERGCSKISVLVFISGPERFDTGAFFDMVFSFESAGFDIDTISQPLANVSLLSDSITRYDAFLFFDMWQEISASQKDAFKSLTEKGAGLVFLHHSLVSYQQWDEFKNIIGGKYYHDDFEWPHDRYSTYKHDVTLQLRMIQTDHPVTRGVSDFEISDEAYGNVEILENVVPLITTSHPENAPYAGWATKYNNSRIVYLLPGHGPSVYGNVHYRQLIKNALQWSASPGE